MMNKVQILTLYSGKYGTSITQLIYSIYSLLKQSPVTVSQIRVFSVFYPREKLGTIHYVILLIMRVLQCLTPNHKTVLAVSHVLTQFKSHSSLYAISEEQSSTYHPSQSILIFPVLVII